MVMERLGDVVWVRSVPYYEQANHTIKIDSKSINEIIDEIKLNMQ